MKLYTSWKRIRWRGLKIQKEKIPLEKIPLTLFISIIYRQYLLFLNKCLEDEGIHAGQTPFILYLKYKKEANQEEMADCYKIDKGSVARSIRKLEELNLINKKTDENNRRKCVLSLTESGEQLAHKIKEINRIWDTHIFEKIDIDEMRVKEVFNLISDVSIETYRELKEGGNNDNWSEKETFQHWIN